jgi:hypothetical protein
MGTPIADMNPVFLLVYAGGIVAAVVFCYLAWRAEKPGTRR